MKQLIIIMLITLMVTSLSAVEMKYEMDTLVDAPTAGMLHKGETDIFTEMYKDNGLLLGVRVCVIRRIMFGVSYGAEQLVGNKDAQWHDQVEFYGKFRFLDETLKYPGMAIGYDSQGHGVFHTYKDAYGKEIRRYDIKSKGFFLVMSKNFEFMGNMGLHLGTNYSMENSDDNSNLNIYTGFDKTVGDIALFSLEYDLAINDDGNWLHEVLDEVEYHERGYLNAGLGVYFTENLYLQLKFNDLLNTRGDTSGADRSIRLKYYFDM